MSYFRLPTTLTSRTPASRRRAASASVCASAAARLSNAGRSNASTRRPRRRLRSLMRALASRTGTPRADAMASRFGQISVSISTPTTGSAWRRKRRTAPGTSNGSQSWASPGAQQGLSGAAAGGGAMGEQDASAGSRCAQGVEQRRGGAGLAERDRMHPDRPRHHRLAIEAEPLPGRAGVGRLAPAAPLHAQQVQRRDQAQQQRIGGARHAATGSAAHGAFDGKRPVAARAALCTPFHAAHTAATVGTGSPSTATWRPPLWRACGPVRHEVGKL